MKLKEPRVEFVEISLINTEASSLCSSEATKRGSIETCTGPDAPYNQGCAPNVSLFHPNN